MAAIIKPVSSRGPVKRIRFSRGKWPRNLSECDTLMVTKYLPLKKKMKLVDIFPPVIGQIKVFHHTPGDVDGQVQLFNKLYNVKTIVFTSLPSSFLNSPGLVLNPGVNCFRDSNWDIIESSNSWFLVPFVERILESHPEYDGSCIKNYFEVDSRVINMVQRNPRLKIKLIIGRAEQELLNDERIKSMIVAFRGVDEEFIASLPEGMIFDTVTYVEIDDHGRPFSYVQIEIMEEFLRRTPNLTRLRLRQSSYPDVNVDSVIRLISSIKNLEHLELSVQFSSVHFKLLLEFLLTSRQLVKLKYLAIDYGSDTRDASWIVSALELDIKPGFRQLSLEHECLVGVGRPPKAKFVVRKRIMTIQNINPRLVDTFNKFARVKYIEVFSNNGQYRTRCQTDLETIRNNRPAVTMSVRGMNKKRLIPIIDTA